MCKVLKFLTIYTNFENSFWKWLWSNPLFDFFYEELIMWPLNLTSCGYDKFMKVICAFDELKNFIHVETQL